MIEKRAVGTRRIVQFYTSQEVGTKLGITPRQVLQLAHSRKLGQRFGVRGWLFSRRDIAGMRVRRRAGRPRKQGQREAEPKVAQER